MLLDSLIVGCGTISIAAFSAANDFCPKLHEKEKFWRSATDIGE